MVDPAVSSLDQLKTLLEEDKISPEDYETLRAAIEAKNRPTLRRLLQPPRLMKSRALRQVGGVCAGLARHYGFEPWRVRMLLLLALESPFLMALVGMNLFVVLGFYLVAIMLPLLYAVLFFLMPWDAPAPPEPTAPHVRRSGGFAGRLGLLWLAFFMIQMVLPRFIDVLAQKSAALELLPRLALAVGGSFSRFGLLVLWQFLVLVGVHMALAEWPRARRIFGRVVLSVLIVFFLVDVIAVLSLIRQASR